MKISNGTMIIVCGLPGAGKTTYAKNLEKELKAIRYCPDEWMEALGINLHDEQMRERIEAFQLKQAETLLSLGMGVSVIIEWGTWAEEERMTLLNAARAIGSSAELHYLPIDEDEAFRRIQARGQEDPPLTREDVASWFCVFQPPTAVEQAYFDRYVEVDNLAPSV